MIRPFYPKYKIRNKNFLSLLHLERYVSGKQLTLLIENLESDIYYDVYVAAIYSGDIRSLDSIGKTPTNGEQCSCRSYLIKQRGLERIVRNLVSVIEGLQTKIDNISLNCLRVDQTYSNYIVLKV